LTATPLLGYAGALQSLELKVCSSQFDANMSILLGYVYFTRFLDLFIYFTRLLTCRLLNEIFWLDLK
jgi:hypothetical protein